MKCQMGQITLLPRFIPSLYLVQSFYHILYQTNLSSEKLVFSGKGKANEPRGADYVKMVEVHASWYQHLHTRPIK